MTNNTIATGETVNLSSGEILATSNGNNTESCSCDLCQANSSLETNEGTIVVANRGSGNISVQDEVTGELIRTVDLPVGEGDNPGEPMYVYNLTSTNEIVVDDRANNRVVFFDSTTFEVTGTVETGEGNFHMWASPQEDQLWVANDIDNTLTVIDPQAKAEITRVALPDEIIGVDSLPHDVIIDPTGDFAYVTVFQNDNPDNDLLVKIDANTFEILDTAEVGKDPHVSLNPESNLLYVPAADSSRIDVFDRRGTELVQVDSIEQPGAHGIEFSNDGSLIYTTNLPTGEPGNGESGLFVIDPLTNEIVGDVDGIDTSAPGSHNVWLNGEGDRLFLTHSGPEATTVDVFSLEDPTNPILETSTDTNGLNPFGLAYAAPAAAELQVGTEENDVLQGGLENDRIFGEAGEDIIEGNDGNDKLLGRQGADKLIGGNGNDVLIGGLQNDALVGGAGDDLLIGVRVESSTPGAGEIDYFAGGTKSDTFVLGDALEVYYDDGDGGSHGVHDLAVIRDFNADEDVIRLHGNADNYSLQTVGSNTAIHYNVEGQISEVIGLVENTANLDIAGSAFEFTAV